MKQCQVCGVTYDQLPPSATKNESGYWFRCEKCSTLLFYSKKHWVADIKSTHLTIKKKAG